MPKKLTTKISTKSSCKSFPACLRRLLLDNYFPDLHKTQMLTFFLGAVLHIWLVTLIGTVVHQMLDEKPVFKTVPRLIWCTSFICEYLNLNAGWENLFLNVSKTDMKYKSYLWIPSFLYLTFHSGRNYCASNAGWENPF